MAWASAPKSSPLTSVSCFLFLVLDHCCYSVICRQALMLLTCSDLTVSPASHSPYLILEAATSNHGLCPVPHFRCRPARVLGKKGPEGLQRLISHPTFFIHSPHGVSISNFCPFASWKWDNSLQGGISNLGLTRLLQTTERTGILKRDIQMWSVSMSRGHCRAIQ